jgi:hypothetical protein
MPRFLQLSESYGPPEAFSSSKKPLEHGLLTPESPEAQTNTADLEVVAWLKVPVYAM